MSNNVINPYQTFRDSNGAVRASGTVTFYVNGTTTLATIYSDEALTVTQTNPYTLDAFGRIVGDVKYQGLMTLKEANSDGSDPITTDNVATLETANLLRSDLASTVVDDGTKGFHLVYFPLTSAENTAGVTPTAYEYPELTSLRYGPNRDGATDDTTVFSNMQLVKNQNSIAGNSGIWTSGTSQGSAKACIVDWGAYKIDSAISADTVQQINNTVWKGDRAAFIIAAGVTAFGGIGFNDTFEGLVFSQGATALSIRTNNADTSMINIINCEFHDQTTSSVKTDSNSNSTHLIFDRCKFIMETGGGKCIDIQSGDFVTVRDCWITAKGINAAIEHRGGTLHIQRGVGVPDAALGRWIDNYASVIIDEFRFGGEAGGVVPIRNYSALDSTPSITLIAKVALRNCTIFASSSDYVIEFYELPNIVEITNNKGLVSTLGLYFDSTLTTTDFRNFQEYGLVDIKDNFATGGTDDIGLLGNNTTAGRLGIKVFTAMRAKLGQIPIPLKKRIAEGDLLGTSIVGGSWSADTATNVTTATSADAYAVNRRKVTASADNAAYLVRYNEFLVEANLTFGRIYTVNLVVDVEAEFARFQLVICGAIKTFHVNRGRSVLAVPFVYLNDTAAASTTYDKFSIQVNMELNGDIAYIGRITLIEGIGQVPANLIIEGSTSPAGHTAGVFDNKGYVRGDVNYRTGVAASGPWGDFCTATGNPGTWKAVANISA